MLRWRRRSGIKTGTQGIHRHLSSLAEAGASSPQELSFKRQFLEIRPRVHFLKESKDKSSDHVCCSS